MVDEQNTAARPLELVHPVYLDVPMLVSFVASLEGGAAFESEETARGGKATGREREATGRGRVGIPLLSALVGADLSGRYGRSEQEQESKETRIVRQHTEASLFNLLRHELASDGRLTVIDGASTLADVKVGDLIEMSGEVIGNPLEQMLNLFFQIIPYLGFDVEALSKPRKPKDARRSGNPAKAAAARSGDNVPEDFTSEDLFRLLATMRADLGQASIRDLVLVAPDGVRAVLTLSTEFLERAADYLLGGRYTVIGKVTRVLGEGESINLTRRTALGLGGPELSKGLVSDLRKTEDLFVEIGDPIVEPPGVQLLPLAVFV